MSQNWDLQGEGGTFVETKKSNWYEIWVWVFSGPAHCRQTTAIYYPHFIFLFIIKMHIYYYFIFIFILVVYLSDEGFIVVFDQDDPTLQVAIKSCKNPESREKFLEEACKYLKSLNNQQEDFHNGIQGHNQKKVITEVLSGWLNSPSRRLWWLSSTNKSEKKKWLRGVPRFACYQLGPWYSCPFSPVAKIFWKIIKDLCIQVLFKQIDKDNLFVVG